MTRHAFISHSHKDADAADLIVAALESRGVKCWTAPRDVSPGGSYAESILTAIEKSSCFVLVYTQHANVSPHVLREVERALTLGINIIPLRFDDSNVSKSLDYLLATVHWLSVIAEPREVAIGNAAERIVSCVSDAPASLVVPNPPLAVPSPVKSPPPAASTSGTDWRSLAGPILVLLVLALLGLTTLVLGVRAVRRFASKENLQPQATATALPSAVVMSTPEASVVAAAPPPLPAETIIPRESVTPAPAPIWNSPTPTASRETPLSVVRRYFDYLSSGNTIKAYELLSIGYCQRETFVVYTRNFASTTALRLIDAHQVSIQGSTATVFVSFEKNNQKFGWIKWRGPVQLTAEAAGWRIDSLRGLKASSGRR